jgi:hypothetical protein
MSASTPKRNCPVAGCNVLVPENKAMCPNHWAALKNVFKVAIITEYRNHAGSAAHLAAIDAACKSLEANPKEAA